jgi:hypothetical protein
MPNKIDKALDDMLQMDYDPIPEEDMINSDFHPMAKVLEPVERQENKEIIDTTQDVKDDYTTSREVAHNLLLQQQEMIKSMGNFLNTAPSPRAYEVLNQMMKTAMEMNRDLMGLQKDLQNLQKEEKKEETGAGTNIEKAYVFTGGPSEILAQLDKNEVIDVTPEPEDE